MKTPYALIDAVYAEGAIGIFTNQPTDVAISNPQIMDDTADIVVMTSCIVQLGTGTTQLNAAIGVHHKDGSGGSTPSNLGVTVNAGETFKSITRTWRGSPAKYADAAGVWGDVTFRLGLTQIGASANGSAFAVGIFVFQATQIT